MLGPRARASVADIPANLLTTYGSNTNACLEIMLFSFVDKVKVPLRLVYLADEGNPIL